MDDDLLLEADAVNTPLCESLREEYDDGPLLEAVTRSIEVLQESNNVPQLSEESVFDDRGVAEIAIIRPCVSRGRRLRGYPPYYSPAMLEENAGVWTGWPMYMDHVAPRVAEAMARAGRSMKELGGQVLRPYWDASFVHEDDEKFGYMRGAVLAEAWGTPFMQQLVGNNPNLLHVSINAYPKSGRVEEVAGTKAMAIEGIRSEPQGSVDYVPRGGAGGRLLPRRKGSKTSVRVPALPGAREREVSPAQVPYASRHMEFDFANATAEQLREHLQKHRPELLPALSEQKPDPASAGTGDGPLTEEAVSKLVDGALEKFSETMAERQQRADEEQEERDRVREEQRDLAAEAKKLIEKAEGLPATWKAELIERYSYKPTGPTPALQLCEAELDGEKVVKDAKTVLAEHVEADIQHSLKLIAEAQGKPVIGGQGGSSTDTNDGGQPKRGVRESNWASELGIATEAAEGETPEYDAVLEGIS